MLTLKVYSTNSDGFIETHILSGDRISHLDQESRDHNMKFAETDIVLGTTSGSSSDQPFILSVVRIFKDGYKQDIYILPKADCFIMEDGKTVDTFSCNFK